MDNIAELIHKNEEKQRMNERTLSQNLEMEAQIKVMLEELKLNMLDNRGDDIRPMRSQNDPASQSIYDKYRKGRYAE